MADHPQFQRLFVTKLASVFETGVKSRGVKSSVTPSMDHLELRRERRAGQGPAGPRLVSQLDSQLDPQLDSQLTALLGWPLARQLAAQRASGRWRVNHGMNMTLYAAAAEAVWMHPCRLVRRAGCATGQLPHKGARAVQSTARARGPLASNSLYTGSRLTRERRRRRMAIA